MKMTETTNNVETIKAIETPKMIETPKTLSPNSYGTSKKIKAAPQSSNTTSKI
jgi:hypothetical protein